MQSGYRFGSIPDLFQTLHMRGRGSWRRQIQSGIHSANIRLHKTAVAVGQEYRFSKPPVGIAQPTDEQKV